MRGAQLAARRQWFAENAPALAEMLDEVHAATGYEPEDLRRHDRHQPLADIRKRCIRQAYAMGFSKSEIGRVFDRNETTILYATRGKQA